MGFKGIGLGLVIMGGMVALIGAALWLFGAFGVPLGRLPGDISIETRRGAFHFPVVTGIVVSVVLTVVLNLILRFFR